MQAIAQHQATSLTKRLAHRMARTRSSPSSRSRYSSDASSPLFPASGSVPKPPFGAPGFGQAHPSTHPHLLAPGELTAGISAEEYEGRRKALMDGLEEGSVVVIAGGRLKYLSGAIL